MFTANQALKLAQARLFSITGRSSRAEYWWVILVLIAVNIIANVIVGVLSAISSGLGGIVALIVSLILLVLGICTIPLFIRRLHDNNLSGWWALLLLVPIVGGIFALVCCVLPGKKGANRFGINPVEDLEGHYNYYVSGQHKATQRAYGAVNNVEFGANPFAQAAQAGQNMFNQAKNQFNQGQAEQQAQPQQQIQQEQNQDQQPK